MRARMVFTVSSRGVRRARRPAADGPDGPGERVRGERVCGLLEVNKKTKSKYVVID